MARPLLRPTSTPLSCSPKLPARRTTRREGDCSGRRSFLTDGPHHQRDGSEFFHLPSCLFQADAFSRSASRSPTRPSIVVFLVTKVTGIKVYAATAIQTGSFNPADPSILQNITETPYFRSSIAMDSPYDLAAPLDRGFTALLQTADLLGCVHQLHRKPLATTAFIESSKVSQTLAPRSWLSLTTSLPRLSSRRSLTGTTRSRPPSSTLARALSCCLSKRSTSPPKSSSCRL